MSSKRFTNVVTQVIDAYLMSNGKYVLHIQDDSKLNIHIAGKVTNIDRPRKYALSLENCCQLKRDIHLDCTRLPRGP